MPLFSPGPAPLLLEIHWSLGQSGRYVIRFDDLADRTVPLDVAGRRVVGLSPNDIAAHLLLHHLQHYFDRTLKWAVDVHRITADRDFSWSTLCERLARWRGLSAVAISLRHL